jgi:hypothetical protein
MWRSTVLPSSSSPFDVDFDLDPTLSVDGNVDV